MMDEQQWHVFYRTIGMHETGASGFRRADFLADSAMEAIDMLLENRRNILHARAYPGASVLTVQVNWAPKIVVKHEPHSTDGIDGGLF
jgi:hypothetical protein